MFARTYRAHVAVKVLTDFQRERPPSVVKSVKFGTLSGTTVTHDPSAPVRETSMDIVSGLFSQTTETVSIVRIVPMSTLNQCGEATLFNRPQRLPFAVEPSTAFSGG